MSKVLDSINQKYSGKIAIEKTDISIKRNVAVEFKVQYVPHLLFIDAEGKIFKQEVGYMQEEEVLLTFQNAGINIG